jgi:hypothetical protein
MNSAEWNTMAMLVVGNPITGMDLHMTTNQSQCRSRRGKLQRDSNDCIISLIVQK